MSSFGAKWTLTIERIGMLLIGVLDDCQPQQRDDVDDDGGDGKSWFSLALPHEYVRRAVRIEHNRCDDPPSPHPPPSRAHTTIDSDTNKPTRSRTRT